MDEVTRLENKMSFCFKNFNKDILMTTEDEEEYSKNKICRFVKKYSI